MKVLLTGYSGNLGRPTARALTDHGITVRALLHRQAIDKRDLEPGVDIVWGDLADPDRFFDYVDGCDAVIHAAWMFDRTAAARYDEVNVLNAVRLLEAAVKAGAHTFVEISSVAVYGLDAPAGAQLGEHTPLVTPERALDVYPAAKVRAERLLAQRADELGIRLVIVRPGLLYSDTSPPVKRVIAGRGLVVGAGRNHLPFVHVDDVAAFIVRALEQSEIEGPYNVVGSDGSSAWEFARAWTRERASSLRVQRIPVGLFKLMVMAPWLVGRIRGRRKPRPDSAYPVATGTRDCRYADDRACSTGWVDTRTQHTVSS